MSFFSHLHCKPRQVELAYIECGNSAAAMQASQVDFFALPQHRSHTQCKLVQLVWFFSVGANRKLLIPKGQPQPVEKAKQEIEYQLQPFREEARQGELRKEEEEEERERRPNRRGRRRDH